jgi:hypothetical protein
MLHTYSRDNETTLASYPQQSSVRASVGRRLECSKKAYDLADVVC